MLITPFVFLFLGIFVGLRVLPRLGIEKIMPSYTKNKDIITSNVTKHTNHDLASQDQKLAQENENLIINSTPKSVRNLAPALQELSEDPSFRTFFDIIVRKKATVKKLLWMVDKTEIWFGVSTGLLGMSLAAIAYNFIDKVMNQKELFSAISYGIFFLAFSHGLYRYWSRKNALKRLENDLAQEKRINKDNIAVLKSEHDLEVNKLFDQLVERQSKNDHVLATNDALHRRNKNLSEKYQSLSEENQRLSAEIDRLRKSKKVLWRFKAKSGK